MKKLLITLLLFGTLFSGYFKTGDNVMVKELANGRESHSPSGKWNTYVCPGCELSVVDVYGTYVYVEVTGNTDHVGKKGFVWVERVYNGKIIKEGVCVRSEPKRYDGPKDKNVICAIRKGASVKVLYAATTWVKVTGSCLPTALWVWAGNIVKTPK